MQQVKGVEFETNTFQLSKGDAAYLLTDRHANQIDGLTNKKFYYPTFRDLLTKSYSLAMKSQCEILENTINDWKGNREQIDDMLIIGFNH